jgi:hypothetical protein
LTFWKTIEAVHVGGSGGSVGRTTFFVAGRVGRPPWWLREFEHLLVLEG